MKDLNLFTILVILRGLCAKFLDNARFVNQSLVPPARHKLIILVAKILRLSFHKTFTLRGHFFFPVKPFLQVSLYSIGYLLLRKPEAKNLERFLVFCDNVILRGHNLNFI